MNAPFRKPMTAREFLAWVETRPDGKDYRLVNGEPIKMAAERSRQTKAKFRIAKALEAAIEQAHLPCHVLADGITVMVDEYTAYEPDATVYCGEEIDDDAMVLENPLVVVEVLSPTTAHIDTGRKLADYFKISSVQHYLIVDTIGRRVVQHTRAAAGRIETIIETTIIEAGGIRIDPPGISVPIEAILPARK